MPAEKTCDQLERESSDDESPVRDSSIDPHASTAPGDYAIVHQPSRQLAPSDSQYSCYDDILSIRPSSGDSQTIRGHHLSASDRFIEGAVTNSSGTSSAVLRVAEENHAPRQRRPSIDERTALDRGRSRGPRSTPPISAVNSDRVECSREQPDSPQSDIPEIRLPSPEYSNGPGGPADNSLTSHPLQAASLSCSVGSAEAYTSQCNADAQSPSASCDPNHASAVSQESAVASQNGSPPSALDRLRQSMGFQSYASIHLSPPESLLGAPPPSLASDGSPAESMSAFDPDAAVPPATQLAHRLITLQEADADSAPDPSHRPYSTQPASSSQDGSSAAGALPRSFEHANRANATARRPRRSRASRTNSPQWNPSPEAGPSRLAHAPRTSSPLSNGSISPRTNGLPTRESLGYTTGLENRARYLSPASSSITRAVSPLRLELIEEALERHDSPLQQSSNTNSAPAPAPEGLSTLDGAPLSTDNAPTSPGHDAGPADHVTARSHGIPPLPDDVSDSEWVHEQCITGPQSNRSLLTPSLAGSSDPTEYLEMAPSAPRRQVLRDLDPDSHSDGALIHDDNNVTPFDNGVHEEDNLHQERHDIQGYDECQAESISLDGNAQQVDTGSFRGRSTWREGLRQVTQLRSCSPVSLPNDLPRLRQTVSFPADTPLQPFVQRPALETVATPEPSDVAEMHLFRRASSPLADGHPVMIVTMDGSDPTTPRVLSTELLSASELHNTYTSGSSPRHERQGLGSSQHRLPIEQPPPELREAFLWSVEQQAARALTAESTEQHQPIRPRQAVAQPPEQGQPEEAGMDFVPPVGPGGRRDTVGDLELELEAKIDDDDGGEEVAREQVM